jgi:transposase
MTEDMRNEIIRRRQQGTSQRRIAQDLGVARAAVHDVLKRWAAERAQGAPASLPRPSARRPSVLDAYDDAMRQFLRRYPDMTAVRIHEELRRQGFTGHYSIVRDRVRQLRATPAAEPVVRFETVMGAQAQMDYSSYDIDFVAEGRRRVHLFSYVLSYSRRSYLHFVEAQDLPTTLREHVRAFEHLGGVAAHCLYDNMKVVVLRHGDEGPLYNPKFLAFASHYGFAPRACRVRRSQTKGKVERHFHYVESNFLNGRTFRTLEHLNEMLQGWLANVADVRVHRETRQRPVDRHAEERPHLLPLPATPYDVSVVEYRVVDVEGFVAWRQNLYSVPWRHIGQALAVRVNAATLIVYGPQFDEIARHDLLASGVSGQRCLHKSHRPSADPRQHEAALRQRFAELGPVAQRFLDGLLREQRYGKEQAAKVLALHSTYTRADWLAALERAVRFGAFSLAAVERILATQAKPKSPLETLADRERQRLAEHLCDNPVSPRPTADYQHLMEPPHGPPSETPSNQDNAPPAGADDRADARAGFDPSPDPSPDGRSDPSASPDADRPT